MQADQGLEAFFHHGGTEYTEDARRRCWPGHRDRTPTAAAAPEEKVARRATSDGDGAGRDRGRGCRHGLIADDAADFPQQPPSRNPLSRPAPSPSLVALRATFSSGAAAASMFVAVATFKDASVRPPWAPCLRGERGARITAIERTHRESRKQRFWHSFRRPRRNNCARRAVVARQGSSAASIASDPTNVP